LVISSKGQVIPVPWFEDKTIAQSIIDSLQKNQNVSEILIIYTDIAFKSIKSDDSKLTFICWENNNKYYTQIISRDKIYKVVCFEGKEIFNYQKKTQTFVTKDEQELIFIPPVQPTLIGYFKNKSEGYFEQPKSKNEPVTYSPNNKIKEKLRKEWFQIIYKTLVNIQITQNDYRPYDRYKE